MDRIIGDANDQPRFQVLRQYLSPVFGGDVSREMPDVFHRDAVPQSGVTSCVRWVSLRTHRLYPRGIMGG